MTQSESRLAPLESAGRTFCPPGRRRHVLVAAILASSLGFIDGTVVSIAIPAIRSDLGASLAAAQWVSSSYLLMLSSLLLAGGAIGDRFGLRNVFFTGIVFFVVASLACSIAPDPLSLIVARTIQGIGAAIMVPASLAIIAKAYPAEERGGAIGIWAAASAATSGIGPLLGGLVLAAAGDWGWRLIFTINLPLGIAALLFLARVPPDRPDGARRLDLAGVLLATSALALVAFGLSGGTAAFGTGAGDGAPPADWRLAASGVILFAGFLIHESRTAQPMMPLRMFRNPGFAGANLATFLLYFALAAIFFFLPMTLITAWDVNTIEAALVFVPITVLVGAMSGTVGKIAGQRGPRLFMTSGSLICALAYFGIGLTMHLQQFWLALMPLITLAGFGMGLLVSPLSAAVMMAVPDQETGMASAINNMVARLSGLAATASLGGLATAVFVAAGASADGLSFGRVPGSDIAPDLLPVWESASNAAFAAISHLCGAASLCAAAVSWFSLDDRPLLQSPGRAAG